jgi:hypothetical protein
MRKAHPPGQKIVADHFPSSAHNQSNQKPTPLLILDNGQWTADSRKTHHFAPAASVTNSQTMS